MQRETLYLHFGGGSHTSFPQKPLVIEQYNDHFSRAIKYKIVLMPSLVWNKSSWTYVQLIFQWILLTIADLSSNVGSGMENNRNNGPTGNSNSEGKLNLLSYT